jgi:hypothetical protein
MPKYEDGKVAKLSESLKKAGIAQNIIEQIMEGGEAIRKSMTPEVKAEWMKKAMLRMNKLLDKDIRQAVREACVCCLGGKRLKLSKAIARRNGPLADRIKVANETKLVFGHSVTMQEDGRILVSFAPEGLPEYGCACFGRKVKGPLPITYCYCCGGHVKHHLQIAMGRKLACHVRSSALASGGKKPCTFLFSLDG